LCGGGLHGEVGAGVAGRHRPGELRGVPQDQGGES
jgi:hypothetical protein